MALTARLVLLAAGRASPSSPLQVTLQRPATQSFVLMHGHATVFTKWERGAGNQIIRALVRGNPAGSPCRALLNFRELSAEA